MTCYNASQSKHAELGAPPHHDDCADTTFGAALRRYRVAAKLTQEELAGRAGLSLR